MLSRDERIFLGALGQANQELGRYVVRVLQESTGTGVTEYSRALPGVELALGLALLDFGHQLIQRAEARGLVVVEGVAPQAKALDRPVGEPTQTGLSANEVQQ